MLLRKGLHLCIMETRKRKIVSMINEITIIKCSEQLFNSKGLKFTIDDIAANLHCAKKTIYKYFATKEELLNAMIEHGFDSIYKNKLDIINSNLSYKEKLKKAMIALPPIYQYFDFTLLNQLQLKYPLAYKNLVNKLETNWEPIIELINTGQKENIIKDIDIAVLKTMVTATIENYLNTNVLKDNGLTYNQGLEKMMDIIMEGICLK